MSDDRVFLFGVLAVHRKLVTQDQLNAVADDNDQALDEALVRSGLLSTADRQELWAEVERLVKKYSGDVPRIVDAIHNGPGESTFDEQHTSTADNGRTPEKPAEEFDELGATVIAHREETVNAPAKSGSSDAIDPAAESPASSSDPLIPDEQTNPFEETVISKNEIVGDKDSKTASDSDPDDVFSETIESHVDPDAGILQTVDRARNADEVQSRETVDYQPGMQSRYMLTRVHGEGGLGQVWLAVDPSLNRDVALKRIRPGKGSSRDAQLRLIREAQITGQLEHPNIMPVYELEQRDEKGRPYYTILHD